MLFLDLETRSQVDLLAHGLPRYAQDASTQVICMSYCFNDDSVATWFADSGDDFPFDVVEYIYQGGPITAHNATFERYLFDYVLANDYGFTPPKLEQWRCSSATAMAHGLPGSLGPACRALNLPQQKQSEGSRLISTYSAPGFETEWREGDRELMQEYCEHDVLAMRQLCRVLRELTPEEWRQYHITEKINDHGAPINVQFAKCALEYADEIRQDVAQEIKQLTNGAVLTATGRKARDKWLSENLTPELLELITVKKKGVEKIKFDKEYRAMLMAHADTPEQVVKFVDLVEQAGGATISKYSAMVNTHVDGRVHGSLIWNGAGQTGRFSSRGLQLQNMRRDAFSDPKPLIDDICNGYAVDRPAETLGRLIRSAICNPEQGLAFSDYSQIEARVLPWLTNHPSAQTTLDVFREDRDIYTENARYMFQGMTIEEKDARQAAKVGVLGCGFGGGKGAIHAMSRGYGLKYTNEQAQDIVSRWRSANPWAKPFWFGLYDAAEEAYKFPGTVTGYGRINFCCSGQDVLWMRLPSGRFLAYMYPRIELVDMPWPDPNDETKPDRAPRLTALWGASKPAANARKWPRRALSHLVLAENATQGTAADIMREAIVRAHDAGLKILFSVHDELVIENEADADKLEQIMLTPPSWADGLPLAAETSTGRYYGK